MNFGMFFLFVTLFVSISSAPQENRQSISDETIDKAISDRRYLTRQLKCILGEVPCDSTGRRLRSLAPLVLRGSCPQCTTDETRQIHKVLAHVQKNYPKEWNKLLQKYASG